MTIRATASCRCWVRRTISCSIGGRCPTRTWPAAVETVRASASAAAAVKLAFEFLVLTAARSGEVRLATWDEIDMVGRVWTIAAARMKAKREHRVPLCRRALDILDAAGTLGDGSSGLVFPMRGGRPISMATLPKMLQQHRIEAVPNGFRSSFRDWEAEETDHPREVICRTSSGTRSMEWTPPPDGIAMCQGGCAVTQLTWRRQGRLPRQVDHA